MAKRVEELLTSAREQFGQLSQVDKRLFCAVAEGKAAVFRMESDELNDPALAVEWGRDRTLQADRIVWLCTDAQAKQSLTYRGIFIVGARVEGELDLNFATIEVPVRFVKCVFSTSLSLKQAKLPFLSLEGTHVVSILADRIQVEGSVLLNNGFYANGEVQLLLASIGGDLDCNGGHFCNTLGDALSADGANIAGSVFLQNGFYANGEVRLLLTSIGGNLDCNGGHFCNTLGDALSADGAKIAGSVFLQNGFDAQGGVRLLGVSIGGDLDCNGGHFLNPLGVALSGERASIAGSVFLQNGFDAQGGVRLLLASIGGDLKCNGGHFLNPLGDALSAERANITGSIFLQNGFDAQGGVRLLGVSIGGDLKCSGGHFSKEKGAALSVERGNITGNVFLNNGFVANGEVRLLLASIGGDLKCSGGHFSKKTGNALSADDAKIGGNVFLNNGFYADGEVRLPGVSIGGNLDCSGGHFFNPLGDALSINSANIEGDVCFTSGFMAQGRVSLSSAKIDDTLCLRGIENAQQMKLDLKFARVGKLVDEEQSWPGEDGLFLNGFTYSTIGATNGKPSPLDSKKRLKWLRLQPESEVEFALQPYEQLALVLRDSGHEAAAIEVLIGKQHDQRRYGKLSKLGYFWNRFLDVSIAYGYRPHRTLWASLAFVFLGTFLFSLGDAKGLISPYSNVGPFAESQAEPNSQVLIEDYPAFNPLMYSLDVFLPIVDFHQESYWLPNPKKGNEISLLLFKTREGNILLWYLWFHIILGWVLTSLWVAGFTGLVRS